MSENIVYNEFDFKEEQKATTAILAETNLIDPLINIVKDYNSDNTGITQYIVNRDIGYDATNWNRYNYGIFTTFDKALIAVLSLTYSGYINHTYDRKTGWTFNSGLKNMTVWDIYRKFESHATEDGYENKIGNINNKCEIYSILEFKTNFLGFPQSEYKIRYAKLYKDDVLVDPQPSIMIQWCEQLDEFVKKD
jgi:hypothetical protein